MDINSYNRHLRARALIEVKNDLKDYLLDLVTPYIVEGLNHIYEGARKKHKELVELKKTQPDIEVPHVLKVFQVFLESIPNWNNNKITEETYRVKSKSRSEDYFDSLVISVVKSQSSLILFMTENEDILKDKNFLDIKSSDLVHKVYLECARHFYLFPHLFFDEFPSIKIKENQEKIHIQVRRCITQAIKHVNPDLKEILEKYNEATFDMEKPKRSVFDKNQFVSLNQIIEEGEKVKDEESREIKESKESQESRESRESLNYTDVSKYTFNTKENSDSRSEDSLPQENSDKDREEDQSNSSNDIRILERKDKPLEKNYKYDKDDKDGSSVDIVSVRLNDMEKKLNEYSDDEYSSDDSREYINSDKKSDKSSEKEKFIPAEEDERLKKYMEDSEIAAIIRNPALAIKKNKGKNKSSKLSKSNPKRIETPIIKSDDEKEIFFGQYL